MVHSSSFFGVSMLPYTLAIASSLLVYGACQLLVVWLYGASDRLAAMFPGKNNVLYLTAFLVSLCNCLACAGAVLTASSAQPRLRLRNNVLVTALVAFLIGCLQLASLVLLFDNGAKVGLGSELMVISVVYYGGLLTTGAVACFIYERINSVFLIQKREAFEVLAEPSPYNQALARLELRPDAKPFAQLFEKSPQGGNLVDDVERTVITSAISAGNLHVEEAITFFDYDLILLEDELLRMRPDPEAYISAMRLGIAIEKDQGYANCRARNYTFSQLMKDLSMRLAVSEVGGIQWSELADDMAGYGRVSFEQRHVLVQELELQLLDALARLKKPGQKVREPLLVPV